LNYSEIQVKDTKKVMTDQYIYCIPPLFRVHFAVFFALFAICPAPPARPQESAK